MTLTLEPMGHFLFEERTKSYKSTAREYPQKKNVLEAKNVSRVLGSAKKSGDEVWESWA